MSMSGSYFRLIVAGTAIVLLLASSITVLTPDESDATDGSGTSADPYTSITGNINSLLKEDPPYPYVTEGAYVNATYTSLLTIQSITVSEDSGLTVIKNSSREWVISGYVGKVSSITINVSISWNDFSYRFLVVQSEEDSDWTDLGNYTLSGDAGSDNRLYTSMDFSTDNARIYGNTETIYLEVYVAVGSTVNIHPDYDFITSSVSGFEGWPSLTAENFGLFGTITQPGTFDIRIVSDGQGDVILTVHAIEVLISYTVTFDSNGGSQVASQLIEDGDPALTPDNPTLYGFVFKGWFTDNGTFLNEWDFSDPVTCDMTLYAKWEGDLEFTTDPIADGTVTAVEGSPGTAIFAATGSQNYNTVLWDFGDGSTSTNTYATHYYSQSGTYTATLTVFNNNGSDTMEFTIEVPEMAGGGQ